MLLSRENLSQPFVPATADYGVQILSLVFALDGIRWDVLTAKFVGIARYVVEHAVSPNRGAVILRERAGPVTTFFATCAYDSHFVPPQSENLLVVTSNNGDAAREKDDIAEHSHCHCSARQPSP